MSFGRIATLIVRIMPVLFAASLLMSVPPAYAADQKISPPPRTFEFIPGYQEPDRQRELIEILNKGRLDYDGARTVARKAEARVAMQIRLTEFMQKDQEARGWIALVKEIGTTAEGDASLSIAIAPNIILSTFWTRARDQTDLTLIREYSPIFETLKTLKIGDAVKIDARMLVFDVSNDDDMVHRPFIIARFRSVTPLQQ